MSEMKSIDELRSMRGNYATYEDLVARCCELADAIERELEERYVELPVDGDGVPIHIGDHVTQVSDRPTPVLGITYHKSTTPTICIERGDLWIDTDTLHHYKPPTIEDVLEKALNEAAMLDRNEGYWPSAADITNIVNEVAPKLRLREDD